MKQAVLPSGETLHFPPETPDEHVHAAVRSKMGLGPPEPPVDPLQQATAIAQSTQQLAAQVADSVVALHQQMSAVAHALNAVAAEIAHVSQATAAASADSARAIADTVQRMEAVNHVVADALTATKVLNKNPDGSFTLNVVK